jgi:hypothetical protein
MAVPRRIRASLLISSLSFVSCADHTSATPWSLDEQFARMAERVPGFGGLFYDERDGAPSVYLVDTLVARNPAVHSLFVSFFNAHPRRPGALAVTEVRYIAGQFDWRDLLRWRRVVNQRVIEVSGIMRTDVDARTNRVVIDVESGAADTEVRNVLSSLDIPEAAVVTRVNLRGRLGDHTQIARVLPAPGAVTG